MGLFSRPAPKPDAVDGLAGTPYQGDVRAIGFREGVHYPVKFDKDGNELGLDTDKPLVWRDGGYHYALPDEPRHFHRYGLNPVDIEVVTD